MTEHILAPVTGSEVGNVAPRIGRASRFAIDGFSGWKRQWLRVLIAMQIACEKLLLVDDAIALRKMVEKYKVKAHV